MKKLKTQLIQEYSGSCSCIAVEAGLRILDVANDDSLDVTAKGDGSPVTLADRSSHECIVAGLSNMKTGLDILSEEGDIDEFLSRGSETFWLVDPLDGTKEFINGLGEYTVNIALIENGVPVMGVVFAPALGTLWTGGLGIGGCRQERRGSPVEISASKKSHPETAVVSRSHLSDETVEFLQANGVTETSPRGSSVKICAVAEGSADIYPRHGPTCIWDTAAGAAVARASGCRVVDLVGDDLDYSPKNGIKRPGFIVYPEGMDVKI